jgi:hypothetical protein
MEGTGVLRHILFIRLKPQASAEQVDAFVQAIACLLFPRTEHVVVGRDISERPGNMDLVVSNGFPDEATYRAWGDDRAGQVNPSRRSSLLAARFQ